MSGPLSTGNPDLDRQLGGGLARGSVVALVTSPESQGELLLKELATAHDSLYLSTTRTAAAVREWLHRDRAPTDEPRPDVQYVGRNGAVTQIAGTVLGKIATVTGRSSDTSDGASTEAVPLAAVTKALESFDRECVVIDPLNPLERGDESTYVQFLHRLEEQVRGSDGVAVLHLVESPSAPTLRWLTLQMADEVWRVTVAPTSDRIEFWLAVTKSRSGDVPQDRIKLHLDANVRVDTSRDIS